MIIEIRDYVSQEGLIAVECEAVPRKGDFVQLLVGVDDEQREEELRRVEYVEWARRGPGLVPLVFTSKVHGRP